MNYYLINGASSGIGHELAMQLAEAGNMVIDTFNQTESDAGNSTIHFYYLNVLDDNLSSDFLTKELAAFVYSRSSINLRPYKKTTPSDFELDYKLQVIGAIKLLQLVLPRLRKFANASIVLFLNVVVQTGLAFHTQVSTFKVAIIGLVRAFSAAYAPYISVNCIASSLTNTPLAASLLNNKQKWEANAFRVTLKRIDSTEDLFDMAIFLLSQKAGFLTGQIL